MGSPLFLLKKTRVNLLQKAMERGYANPLISQRAKGLGLFLTDLAQRNFTLVDTQEEPYVPERDEYDKLVKSHEELIERDYIHKIDTLTLSTVQRARPKNPTATLTIDGLAIARYADDIARKQLHLPDPIKRDRVNFRLASDVINLIGYGVLVPGAWPDKVQPEVHRPQLMLEAWVDENDIELNKDRDLRDMRSLYLSDDAWESLVGHAEEGEYIARLINPGDHESKRPPRINRGISNFFTALADCHFVDNRSIYGPEYLNAGVMTAWRSPGSRRDKTERTRKLRGAKLSDETLKKFYKIGADFRIDPPVRYTFTSVTSVVLEAIGWELLVPTAWPHKFATHGPTL